MPLRFGRNYSAVSEELFSAISAYIDAVYAGAPADALHDPNRARFSGASLPADAFAPEDADYAPGPGAFEEDDFDLELSSGPIADDFGFEPSASSMADAWAAPPPPAAPARESAPQPQPEAAQHKAEAEAPRRASLRRAEALRREQLRRPRDREDKAAPRRAKTSRGLGGLFRRAEPDAAPRASLEAMLAQIDESFGQTLLRRIDERHLTDAQCYKRANVDRRLFNKIKNNPDYRPGKQTVLAFAIALRLSLEETRDLLMKAGYALSHSSKSDIVVEYCILNGIYDIIEINQVLFRLDLQPLGY
ncbi:MAG: hypothetical protein Q4C10_04145 [Clostridia bacterium]|nr:hypothetical protein [Clostridia bacterium]